jgi:hypothetical protein
VEIGTSSFKIRRDRSGKLYMNFACPTLQANPQDGYMDMMGDWFQITKFFVDINGRNGDIYQRRKLVRTFGNG